MNKRLIPSPNGSRAIPDRADCRAKSRLSPAATAASGGWWRRSLPAKGPIWTPLNPFGGADREKVRHFGESTPMGRAGQPNEVAPAFLFLACEDSSYMSGQVLNPNGGIIING